MPRGGKRPGAGRKPADPKRPNKHHAARAPHRPEHPAHVVLRRAKGLPSMRSARIFELIRTQSELVSGEEFRVLFVGAETDHVHVIVEADSGEAMTHGMSALTIRIARWFNKLTGRSGPVWDDRYRARPLRTVKELREALDSFAAAPDDAAIVAKPQTNVARRL